MTFRVLDPTPEKAPPAGQLAPRLATLEGKTIGFISNGKEGTKGFFGHLDRLLREEHGVANVVLRTKKNYSAPANDQIVVSITSIGQYPRGGAQFVLVDGSVKFIQDSIDSMVYGYLANIRDGMAVTMPN